MLYKLKKKPGYKWFDEENFRRKVKDNWVFALYFSIGMVFMMWMTSTGIVLGTKILYTTNFELIRAAAGGALVISFMLVGVIVYSIIYRLSSGGTMRYDELVDRLNRLESRLPKRDRPRRAV